MAMVVENGQGLAAANSYLSIADAVAILSTYNPTAAFITGAVPAVQEAALIQASEYIDLTYGQRFRGAKPTFDQGLLWPRTGVCDRDDQLLPWDVLPAKLKRACAELAAKVFAGETLYEDLDEASEIKSESVSVGSLSQSTTFVGSKKPGKVFTKIDMLLEEFCDLGMGKITRS